MDQNLVNTLNDLIKLDLDAIGAYRAAARACDSSSVRNQLHAFKRDHERHVRDLTDLVTSSGGRAATHRDVRGIFMLGFTKLASRGDYSALVAMRGNEEVTNRVYSAALREDLPEKVLLIVKRNYEDERRHLAWIKEAISNRFWERVEEVENRAEEMGEEEEEPRRAAAGGARGGSRSSARAGASSARVSSSSQLRRAGRRQQSSRRSS